MKAKILSIAAIAFSAIAFQSCQKEKADILPPVSPTVVDIPGVVNVNFDYIFWSPQVKWQLEQPMTHPRTGDKLTFTSLKYYVSNIKFQNSNGDWWSEPESYHLICNTCPGEESVKISDVPKDDYVAMQYTLGVDSAANVSGVYNGALSLDKGMFWDWNSGFIMMKAEGRSPYSGSGLYAFHLGGFKGEENIVTVKTSDFNGSIISIGDGKNATITLQADPGQLWKKSPSVSVRNVIHMPGMMAKNMAVPFYESFTFSGVVQSTD